MPTLRIADADFVDVTDKAAHLAAILETTGFDLTRPITYVCDRDAHQTLLAQYPFAAPESPQAQALDAWLIEGAA